MPLTGEQIHKLGEEGTQRAKRWLESTCRAEVLWNNPQIGVEKLQHRKAGAAPGSQATRDFFSFDLGGRLIGGEVDSEMFFAECKKYQSAQDQGTHFRRFLAGCYRVESLYTQFANHFLWITWAPFLVRDWHRLRTETFVRKAVTAKPETRYIALGPAAYEEEVGRRVASKVLVVVLADGQEVALSLHGDELVHVRKSLLEIRGAA